ncbi:MAG: efflux RND transporter permease subunit [Deltaproteobacteria bacterium]|nr:efflux RND transporter permease subunit [Deltaproteobacteria bacterium]
MSFMDNLIRWSLRNRLVVVVGALALSLYGGVVALRMPVDVFPDLTAPTVTILTEAHGLAPQEVETLVTIPIESAVNGASAVRRVRSSSSIGYSIIWVEFEWDTDIYTARQIVGEKLQLVASQIPADLGPPTLAPISSIMGEILFLGLTSDNHTEIDLRDTADWVIRKRLLAVPGVAQVVPIGGAVKQFQLRVNPLKLQALQVTFDEVMDAIKESNSNSSGGFLIHGGQESLIRGIGRIETVRDIESIVVTVRENVPVRVGQIGDVVIGPALKRGEGSANGKPAVVLAVLKQPSANTLELTREIDRHLDEIETTLPGGMEIERQLFRQSDFIETAVSNVATALRDGAILVAIILFLFLFNFRTTLISLVALPVSLIVSVLAMKLSGASINTMTLGGLTIAIGALVDDAIIDVENVFRRLRENRSRPEHERKSPLDVIYEASREIRGSIVFATLIVMLVFIPVFFLSGVEGRLLAPLGFAYLVAIFASLVVALTLTPALCAYALPRAGFVERDASFVVRHLKRLYLPALRGAVRRPILVIALSAALLVSALVLASFLGRTFLPDFNEGALNISAVTLPGTSLEESDRLGRRVEETLLSFPEVVSTARRTGRAELDEHAQSVNSSEIDVRLEMRERSKAEFLAALREEFSAITGMVILVGQPLSHRIDHMLSGTRASIAIKLFGEDLTELRNIAEKIRAVMSTVEGVADLSVEQQVEIPQLHLSFDREKIARFGLRTGALAEIIEAAYAGHTVSQVLDGGRSYDLVVRYHEDQRADVESIRNTLIDTNVGMKIPLKMLADIRDDLGPNFISRENGQRKIVIMANVQDRDLRGVVDDIRKSIESNIELPEGYYVVYGGQFESESQAAKIIGVLSIVVVAGIFLALFMAFRSAKNALLIMVNLPLALVGGIAAVSLTDGVLSVASLVGFITLFGIATRNGIMLISHYEHMRSKEGVSMKEAVERGSTDRLIPILMTALSSGLALVPLILAGHQPGNEIQAPMGIVILGGLTSSTLLNMFVVPTIYARLGGKAQKDGTSLLGETDDE